MFALLRSRARTTRNNIRRCSLAVETLESRDLLSALHPTVTAVNVGSTQWTGTFVGFLQSQGAGSSGYAVPAGSNQLKSLPWAGLNQIRITFNENVNVISGDLSVSGTNVTAYAFSGFSYDPAACTATWTLAAPLANDKILLDLAATGNYPVHDSAGQVLDGAWTDGTSSFPSGNGNAGVDFRFQVNVLPGDVNGDNLVNSADLKTVNPSIGKNAGDGGYNIRYDTNGSGSINSDDYNQVYALSGSTLPSGNPTVMATSALTALPLADLNVNTNAADAVFSLGDIFADTQDPISSLTVSVSNNTNSALFNSVSISQNQLTLSFAANTAGTAAVTLHATDTHGWSVDNTLYVTVAATVNPAPVNAGPVISDFVGTEGPGGCWTFSGTVSDPNQDVTGMVVTFGGVLAGYNLSAVVQEDGTFEITAEYPGLYSGTATAVTYDYLGLESNVATDYITVSL